jgi:hypothetical protein
VIYPDVGGDQNYFPVYEPDFDTLKAKHLQAEVEARAHHYDASKEGTWMIVLKLT